MPLKSSPSVIPLGRAKGTPLHTISAYQSEETLNLDLQFEDGHCLELVFRIGLQASGTLVKWVNGNSEVVERVLPRRRR